MAWKNLPEHDRTHDPSRETPSCESEKNYMCKHEVDPASRF